MPTLEILILSLKKYWASQKVSRAPGSADARPLAASSSDTANETRKKVDELKSMFPTLPRESCTAALQMANGDATAAADIINAGTLYEADTEDVSEPVKVIKKAAGEIAKRLDDLLKEVLAIPSWDALKLASSRELSESIKLVKVGAPLSRRGRRSRVAQRVLVVMCVCVLP